MKILLTGFEPFDESPINPSEQIIHTMADEPIPGVKFDTAVLPVDLTKGPATILKAFEAVQPDAVICLRQASRRAVLSIERIAVNLLDFRIPDNAGNQVQDQPVVPGGPAGYFTSLPVREIYETLKEHNIPAELSMSAGTYLCNQVTYILMHHLHVKRLRIPAGFIHLPALPEQAAQMKGSIPSMSLETMTQGVRVAVQVIARRK